MKLKPQIPKDLGIKIGSKQEVIWTKIKDIATTEIEEQQIGLILNAEIIKCAEKHIKKEQEK